METSNKNTNKMPIEQKDDMEFSKDRLSNALLILKFLNVNETDDITVKIHWILERTLELDRHKYMISSKWKTGKTLCWGREYALVSTEREKLWISLYQVDISQI